MVKLFCMLLAAFSLSACMPGETTVSSGGTQTAQPSKETAGTQQPQEVPAGQEGSQSAEMHR